MVILSTSFPNHLAWEYTGVYSTSTVFFTVFLAEEVDGIALAADVVNVVPVFVILCTLLFLQSLLYSASSSTEIRSLQLECTLALVSPLITDLSSSLSILFIMDWVDVPLLSLESEFLFLKMLTTLFFNDLNDLN